jgi:hypothetical protein
MSVLCLVEPPRNALPADAYRRAQQRTVDLYKELQEYRGTPMPVAVQEDFWVQVDQYLSGTQRRSLPKGYVDKGGYGVVEAIAGSGRQPHIVRLESASFLVEYKQMESAAIDFMTRSAALFQSLASGYGQVTARHFSDELRRFKSLSDAFKADTINLRQYIAAILELSRMLKLDSALPAFRSLLIYERLAQLEDGIDEEAANRAKQALVEEMEGLLKPEAIGKRAAVELYLYQLNDRFRYDASPETIEQIQGLLELPALPMIPDWMRSSACEVIGTGGDMLSDVIKIDHDNRDRPHKGHGELVSRYLELATVLGIDLNRYEVLKSYVYYVDWHHRLQEISSYAVASEMSVALKEVEQMIFDHLARSDEERRLVGLDRTIRFLEELGRYHVVHDSGLRRVVMQLEIVSLCETLKQLGMNPPAGWRQQARRLDQDFGVIRDFYDRTIVRGKDLASRTTASMREEAAEMMILWCEGYLLDVLTRWLEGRNISYSAIFPQW